MDWLILAGDERSRVLELAPESWRAAPGGHGARGQGRDAGRKLGGRGDEGRPGLSTVAIAKEREALAAPRVEDGGGGAPAVGPRRRGDRRGQSRQGPDRHERLLQPERKRPSRRHPHAKPGERS